MPRGGVVLGVEIARLLEMPLDLIISRKIGHPNNLEYAIGAVTENGTPVYNSREVARVDPEWLEARVRREREEAKRRRERYLGGREVLSVRGKTAILVDDGIATGLTMLAAIHEVKRRKPARIVVAVPVAPEDTAALFVLIATKRVGKRPGRCEPRAVKRRPKPYPWLKKPRAEAREEIRKHGHAKKMAA